MSRPGLSEESNKRWPLAVRALLFFVAYLAGGLLGTRLLRGPFDAAPFSPQSGLMLGALLVAGPGEWFAFALAALAASVLFEAGLHHQGALAGVCFALRNLAMAGVGSWLLRKFLGGIPRLSRARDILRLVFISAGLAVIGGTLSLILAGFSSSDGPIWQLWPFWWGADALGLLMFTPLVLAWAGRFPGGPTGDDKARFAESAAFIAILSVAAAVAFGGVRLMDTRMPYPSLTFPLLLWGSMRLSMRTLTTGIVLLAAIAAISMAGGGGSVWISSYGPGADPGAFADVSLCQPALRAAPRGDGGAAADRGGPGAIAE